MDSVTENKPPVLQVRVQRRGKSSPHQLKDLMAGQTLLEARPNYYSR